MTSPFAQKARLALVLPSALAGCLGATAPQDALYAPKGAVGPVLLGPSVCRALNDAQTRQAALELADQALAASYGAQWVQDMRRVMSTLGFGQCGRWVRIEYAAAPGVATGVVLVDVDVPRHMAIERLDLDGLAFGD